MPKEEGGKKLINQYRREEDMMKGFVSGGLCVLFLGKSEKRKF